MTIFNRYPNHFLKYYACLVFLITLIYADSEAGYRVKDRSLNRGKLWCDYRETGHIGFLANGNAPSGYSHRYPGNSTILYDHLAGGGVWLGARNVSARGVQTEFFIAYSGPRSSRENLTKMSVDPYYKEFFYDSTKSGSYIYDADDFDNDGQTDDVPEEMVVTRWVYDIGLMCTRRAMSWSYADFDDFIIVEYVFENTGDYTGDGVSDITQTLNDVYIDFRYIPHLNRYSDKRKHWAWWRKWGDLMVFDDYLKYDPEQKLFYAWDGDSPYQQGDDTGEPAYIESLDDPSQYPEIGMLTAPAYWGVAPLYVDPAADGSDQPHTVCWWKITGLNIYDEPDLDRDGPQKVYQYMASGIQKPDTGDVFSPSISQVYGPYTIAPGEKIKLVLVEVMGQGMNWQETLAGDQDLLSYGKDSLYQHLENARFLYEHEYDVYDSPPDVAFQANGNYNAEAHVQLTWSDDADDAEDPDYSGEEAQDVAGYRVYRTTLTWLGPFELIADIKKGDLNYLNGHTYQFIDSGAREGIPTYYHVSTYDTGHDDWNGEGSVPSLESGRNGASNRTIAEGFVTPTRVPDEYTDGLMRQVYVIPNPYHRYNNYWPDVNPERTIKIRFKNIPRKCRIRIYSVQGNLVADRLHESDELYYDWYQRTDEWKFVVSGVYIYVIENLMDEASLKDTGFKRFQTGKFTIIQ
ncbi:hypothetical protein JXJ21_10605 [candidate division KSB1 bacterium]|nr:hypothetical protein [candidate division KSB1 bacterium]